jgi:hypothetical protein
MLRAQHKSLSLGHQQLLILAMFRLFRQVGQNASTSTRSAAFNEHVSVMSMKTVVKRNILEQKGADWNPTAAGKLADWNPVAGEPLLFSSRMESSRCR